MSKTKEATNDFCTRCFKYNKCKCAKSECVMADSYQEGYEDGYHQAEKDNELTWKDIEKICLIAKEVHQFRGFWSESVYQEVLKRFNEERKEK